MTSLSRFILPHLVLGLLAAGTLAAGDRPPGSLPSLTEPTEAKTPVPLTAEPPVAEEPWLPLEEAVPNAIQGFGTLRQRLDRVANLVYWDTRRLISERFPTPGKPPAAWHVAPRDVCLIAKQMEIVSSFYYRHAPDAAFLFRQALTARQAQPLDERTRPAKDAVCWGTFLWNDLLPPQAHVDFVMTLFEAIALSVDAASDAEGQRLGLEAASAEELLAFKHASLETAIATHFPEHPGCGEVFRRVATRLTLPLAQLPWAERGQGRKACAAQFGARVRAWVAARQVQVLEREVQIGAARRAELTAELAQLQERLRVLEQRQAGQAAEARRAQERAARKAQNAREQKALGDAESAPPTEDERAHQAELRLEQRARAEALRKLAQEVKKEQKQADLAPGGDSKEEARPQAQQAPLPWRWHPGAEAEFLAAVKAGEVRKRIHTFIKNSLGLKGLGLGMPQAQPITGSHGIWELRPVGRHVGVWRPLYALVQGEFVILAFAPEFLGDKVGFKRALADAQKRRAALLEENRGANR